jgi:hypothetical protein
MLTVTLDGVAYRATPDGTITPDTVVAQIVGDLLESGEPIGPQVDEYAGVIGDWQDFPRAVIAAFSDAARLVGKPLGDTRYVPEPDEAPVVAGFDAGGRWHIPGGPEGGRFAKPGWSGAKAAVEREFRSLIDDARDADDGLDVRMAEDMPKAGLHAGDVVHAVYRDEHAAVVTSRVDGRRIRVPWASLDRPYANLRTPGRETPMAQVNDMAQRPAVAGKAEWYEATVDGQTLSPHLRTAQPPTYMLVARRDDGDPWEAVGFSTADNEADALADAEIAAPRAVAYRAVAGPTVRTEPPPTTVRTVPKPYMAVDDEGWRNHEHVIVNDEFAGIVRQEDRGLGDTTGGWSALDRDWHRLGDGDEEAPFATRQAAVDAVATAEQAHRDRPTDTSQTTHRPRVSKYAISQIQAKVDKLNQRAERKGLSGRVELTVGDTYLITDPSLTEDDLLYYDQHHFPPPQIEVADVTMTATPVVLDGGWSYAGVVDFATMRDAMQGAEDGDLDHDVDPADLVLLHSAAGYQLPQAFKAAAVCDDCGREMPRNKLIVAADANGNLTRLGTTCVRDVLGHDPAKLLWWSEAVRELGDDEDGSWGAASPPVWRHADFVTLALLAIDNYGYTRAAEPDSTRALILDVYEPPKKHDSKRLKDFREKVAAHFQAIDDGDPDPYADEVAAMIHWIRNDAPARSDFDQNLRAAYAGNVVTAKLAGVAAYMPVAYRRTKEKADAQAKAAEAQAAVPNEWIGEPGDKLELTGTIRKIVRTQGYQYGSTSFGITIDTDQGTVMTWTDSGSALGQMADGNEGGTIRFKGTVKSLDEYPRGSGQKQTTLTRVAPVLTRADRLRDQIANAAAKAGAARFNLVNDLAKVASGSDYPSVEGRQWIEDRQQVIDRLDDATLSAVRDAARDAVAEMAQRPVPYANLDAYNGPGGEEVGGAHGMEALAEGTVVGYPSARGSSEPFGGPGPFTWNGSALVAPDGATITPEQVEEAKAVHEDWSRRSRNAARSRLADPVEPEPPSPPTWTVLSVPGVDTPWSDGPITFPYKVGYGAETAVDVTINPDGTVTRGDGQPVEPRFARQMLRYSIDAAKRDHKNTLTAEAREVLDEKLNAAEPAAPADTGPTLTPEWIEAGPWPVDFEYGRTAKTRKTYRIEPGGDVYLDGKRLTDKTGDKILLAALDHFKVDPPPVDEQPVDTPTDDVVGVGDVNDLPERLTLPPLPPVGPTSLPPVVYHVAPKSARESILRDGLVPTPDEVDPDANDGVWAWGVQPTPTGYVNETGQTIARYNPETDDVWAIDTSASSVEHGSSSGEWEPGDPVWAAWATVPARLVTQPEANDLVERPSAPTPVGSQRVLDVLDDAPDVPAEAAALRKAWGGDVVSVGTTRGLQWVAADTFDRPPVGLDPGTRGDDLGLLAFSGASDPAATLTELHADAQATLARHGIDPTATVTLYRGITTAQFDAWDQAGRPERFSSTPLATYRARFADAADDSDGGVFTVDLPAANIVALGAFSPDEVIALPNPDGTVPATRFRSVASDAADVAAGRPVGVPLDERPGIATVAPDDLPVGEAFTLRSGVRLERTPSGFIDQATGQPVHADGTPL